MWPVSSMNKCVLRSSATINFLLRLMYADSFQYDLYMFLETAGPCKLFLIFVTGKWIFFYVIPLPFSDEMRAGYCRSLR